MNQLEFIFTIVYNAVLIVGSIYLAIRTVNRVLKLHGSKTRKVVTSAVLFLTVLGWIATFVLGAFDDFDYPIIHIETYLRVMQVTLLLIILLFYIYVTRPPDTDPDDKAK